MSQQNGTSTSKEGSEYLPSNFRIFSVRTAKRMLHVEDCLHIGRIRFDLWSYEKGNGSTGHVDAYVTTDDARLIGYLLTVADTSSALERNGGGVVKGNVIARTFKMEATDKADYPIRITVANAPGSRQENGLISINKGATPTRIQTLISPIDAYKLGLALAEHLQAWATATYDRRTTAGVYRPVQPTPGDVIDEPADQPEGYDPGPDGYGPDDQPEPANPPTVTYLDGTEVSDNEAEIAAFALYCERTGNKPDSLPSLRSWVRRHNTGVAGAAKNPGK